MQGIRSLRLLARSAVNQTSRRSYHYPQRHPTPTQNMMPVPEGDFMALHSKRNQFYNTVLAVGVCMNAFGLYMLNYGGIVHFHSEPPKTYE